MIATNGETHRRGPYRKGVKIPRQTLYNRRRKISADRLRRRPPHSEPESTRTQPESLSPQDTSLDLNNGEDYDVDMISENSLLLISSYMCRHHLTGQAREDLLELMRLYLPQDNNLPSSLYLLRKPSNTNYHHYCQHAIRSQDCATSLCPNEYCKTTIDLLTCVHCRSAQHIVIT